MRRGDIYFVDLDPVVGREQRGVRPVLVVSSDFINGKPLVASVVPGTDGINVRGEFPSNVRIPPDDTGLPKETVFLCFQIRAVDPARVTGRLVGSLSPGWMARIDDALRYSLGL